ncbi:hypothetical protein, partial [Actinophytocola sp.]|uniref:DUF7927 domain-containing protein n=1 Tax=Actinophytocola sp. TaxID=1872138 RepID=UPI003899F7FB
VGAADYRDGGLGPARWTDDLSEVLDDARYTGDARANAGTLAYEVPVLSWSGPVAAGQTATIVYSVEVHDPASGDGTVRNTITAADSACPCSVRTPVDPDAPDLAGTGSPVFWYLLVAFGLLAAGGAFFLIPVLRRRRRDDDEVTR